MDCLYEYENGNKRRAIVPMSKISHLSYEHTEDADAYFIHTIGGAKLIINEKDFNKAHDILIKTEGEKR